MKAQKSRNNHQILCDKKWASLMECPFLDPKDVFLLYRNSLSYNDNVGSLRSTITLGYIESNGLAFLQSLEAISNDAGEI